MERCPAPEPFLSPQSKEETPARKRGAKSAKVLPLSFQFYYLMIIILMQNQNKKLIAIICIFCGECGVTVLC